MCFGDSQPNVDQQAPRPARRGAQRPIQIGPPTEATIHIPRNRLDAHGVPVQLTSYDIDRESLVNALALMANFLSQRGVNLTAVTVGGAVNCLYLKSRQTTHDVDIFGSNLDTQSRVLLDEAMQHAIQQSHGRLGTDWFNTENQMWMGPNIQKELTTLATRQGTVVFQRSGLTLLAAPWEYAFSGKVQRLLAGGSQVRPYDLDDALNYLAQLVRRNHDQPIPVKIIEGWSRRYNHVTSRDFLMKRVNPEYQRRFGRSGVAKG